MGSYIELKVGDLELDWGKDDLFQNHSALFLHNDIKMVPYYYADEQIETKNAFCRKLRDVTRRLELLGYSIPAIEKRYIFNKSRGISNFPDLKINFEHIYTIIKSIDLGNIRINNHRGSIHVADWLLDAIKYETQIDKIGKLANFVSAHDYDLFDHIHPYTIMRLLMENPNNLDYELHWRYADVLEGGYVSETDLFEEINGAKKFLIVTEGSSDLFIIKKALEILCTDIFDFFSFVDMADNYPFTGTGNLYRFTQGLSSIGLQNQVLIIFDNDTAGCDAYEQTKKLRLPANLSVTKLPELSKFDDFLTLGPSGQIRENINGRAVGIEHFLDLKYRTNVEPAIRWTSYNDKLNAYQGSLVDKEKYVRIFKEVVGKNSGYDFSKLKILTGFLYRQCVGIAERCATSGHGDTTFWYF